MEERNFIRIHINYKSVIELEIAWRVDGSHFYISHYGDNNPI